jgi:hypothetical protein
MNWMEQIGSLLQNYQGAQAASSPENVERDFDQVTNTVPKHELSAGLAEAFRSSETPPFAQMLGGLFGRSDGPQRASILNQLLAAGGPQILAQLGGGIAGLLRGRQSVGLTGAERVSPQDVEVLAAEAEKRNPSIVDRISEIYAEQPSMFKTLGAAALTIAMAKLAQRQFPR